MKFFLLLTPLIATVSFASGYGAKWWNDDVTTRSALQIRFDEATQEAIKHFNPFAISTTEGQIEVGIVCVTEPCGGSYPIAAAALPSEMVAVTRSQWNGMVYADSVFRKINPDMYAEAYNFGSAYNIGHVDLDIDTTLELDW